MKTSIYPSLTTIAIFALAAPLANAETKTVPKGRAGYATVQVAEPATRKVAARDDGRMTTIGLSVGDVKESKPRLHFAGGRGDARITQVRR